MSATREYAPTRQTVYGLGEHPRPCASCWLHCEPRRNAGGWQYPCGTDMRLWVRAHKEDKGDERGYVWE